MKKFATLTLILAAFSSCSNMESDAQKVCLSMEELKETMPEMMKLSFKSSLGTEESKKEAKQKLDSIQKELTLMTEEIEEIQSKYDKDEFQQYLLENCESTKKMKEMFKGLEGLTEGLDNN